MCLCQTVTEWWGAALRYRRPLSSPAAAMDVRKLSESSLTLEPRQFQSTSNPSLGQACPDKYESMLFFKKNSVFICIDIHSFLDIKFL